jgi:uncharacterized protein
MFAIPGLQKLLLLAAIVGAVWWGFKFVGTLGRLRKDAERRAKARASGEATRPVGGRAGGEVEETVKCRVCGAYVPARQPTACERADCPY